MINQEWQSSRGGIVVIIKRSGINTLPDDHHAGVAHWNGISTMQADNQPGVALWLSLSGKISTPGDDDAEVAPKHSMLCQYLLLSVSLVLFKLSDVTFQEAQLVGQSLPV